MHSNNTNTQVQVQIPAAYYSLGSVAMNTGLGFGGSGHHSIDHNPSNSTSSSATPLHPYHPANTALSGSYHSTNHHHSTSPQSAHHGQQHPYSSSTLQKSVPIQHQVDIYQPPHQALDSDLMNPIVNRQLNHSHASNYHSYNYHQHYSSSYYNNNSTSSKQQAVAQQQQQQQQQSEHAEQQSRSNASTPTPTLASNLSTVSSASTPSLSSNTVALTGNNDYTYGSNSNRQGSPASSSATTSSNFNVPASPDQLTVNVNMTQAMSAWTSNEGSSVDQELTSQQAQSHSPVEREHMPFSGNSSPESSGRSPYYQQPAQVWVASMAADDFHAQDILDQDRQHHHQRSYSQSSRYGHSQQQQQPSVASQQSTLPAINGLPLLSPSTMLQSDYQASSYPVHMHDTPTIMSHLDYGRVASSMGNSDDSNDSAHYGPIRTHKKSRTHSFGSQRDFMTRTRTNSTSSVASSGILSSLTATMGQASVSLSTTHEMQEEDEDSDSPTTIQMRPRTNAAPRKAVAARVFECSVLGCTKAYTQLHNLKSHERTGHTPVVKLKPFHCIIEGCAKAFSQRKSLALHIKTAHADFKFKPFRCTQGGCQKAYTQLHNLRTHEKTVHLVDLSRKRIKNPSHGLGGMGGMASLSSSTTASSGQGQMGYQHGGHHSGLGLNYDGLSDLTDLADEHSYYQRQHEQQHHHQQQQQYGRFSHLNTMSSIYDRS
ncbi:hypothetical protein BGZ98_009883 [Dissophora globulifera]|nr:hypothetical protein BGZ98_009883 [Dissophora globulifera]